MVETGAADTLPTLTWANSDGEVSRREFVDLLQRCLSQRMRGRLFFHHQKRILAFPLADHRSSARSPSQSCGTAFGAHHVVQGGREKRSTDPARPIIGTLRLRRRFWRISGANGIWPSNRPTTSQQMATRNIHWNPNAWPGKSSAFNGSNRTQYAVHIGMWRAVLTEGGDLWRTDYPFLRFEMVPALPFSFGVPVLSSRPVA